MSRAQRKNRQGTAGFTLLELMISISLMVLIVALAGSALRGGLSSISAGEEKLDGIERLRSSLQVITAQLQSQFPAKGGEPGKTKLIFFGDAKSIQFASNYSIRNAQTGYVLVKYRTEEQEGKQALRASEHVIGVDSGDEDVLLFSGLDAISFEYFERKDAQNEGNWVSEWPEGKAKLPDAIRIHFARGGQKFSLRFAVKTTV